MQRLRTVTSLDFSALAGHHEMPAALLLNYVTPREFISPTVTNVELHSAENGCSSKVIFLMIHDVIPKNLFIFLFISMLWSLTSRFAFHKYGMLYLTSTYVKHTFAQPSL